MGEIVEAAGKAGFTDRLVQHQHFTRLVDAIAVEKIGEGVPAGLPEVSAKRRRGQTAEISHLMHIHIALIIFFHKPVDLIQTFLFLDYGTF